MSTATQVNYSQWAARVLFWDGMIAVALMLAPLALGHLLEKDGEKHERELMLATALIPSSAFLLRWFIGRSHLAANRCSITVRQVQRFSFFCGMVAMMMGDCLVLALHDTFPPGDWVRPLATLAPFYGVYLLCMIIAMYPGREPAPPEEMTKIGNWNVRS